MGLKKDDSSILLYFTRHITQFSTDRPTDIRRFASVGVNEISSFVFDHFGEIDFIFRQKLRQMPV